MRARERVRRENHDRGCLGITTVQRWPIVERQSHNSKKCFMSQQTVPVSSTRKRPNGAVHNFAAHQVVAPVAEEAIAKRAMHDSPEPNGTPTAA